MSYLIDSILVYLSPITPISYLSSQCALATEQFWRENRTAFIALNNPGDIDAIAYGGGNLERASIVSEDLLQLTPRNRPVSLFHPSGSFLQPASNVQHLAVRKIEPRPLNQRMLGQLENKFEKPVFIAGEY